MTTTPEIQPLSRNHRRFVFILSLVLFCTIVPLLVFYAIGYRIDFDGETRNIRTVGGMYVSADVIDISIFVDDEPVKDMRIFQNAAYIQNLDAGLHQVHVQGNNIKTWVKVLPVYAHFVTEVTSFNMPEVPQLRVVTPLLTDIGESVVDLDATSSFAFASTTNTFYATSTIATSTFVVNPEYTYLSTLFASSTKERQARERERQLTSERFKFPSTATSATTTLATTTKLANNIELRKIDDEVLAVWVGNSNDIPYYFCLTYTGPASTALGYGSHVYNDLFEEYASTTNMLDSNIIGTQLCRTSITIDRLRQSVQYFDFLPGSNHLVLMQLQDGVYVVEIDDRAWQNVQLLYPGDYLNVVVDGGNVFIKDGDNIFEVYTELQNSN